MRKLVLVSASLFSVLVVACGGGSSDGGGGLTGTVGGRSFSPVEVRAISAGSGTTPCSVEAIPTAVGIKAVAIDFASYAGACGDYDGGQCKLHANAQSVTVLLAKLDPFGAEPALKPGTYTVYASPTQAIPDGTGLLTVAYAQALATGAAPDCAGSASPSVQGGTIRLDQVTGPITGHVAITFKDGSALQGDFSAALCPGTVSDICTLATTQVLCTPPPLCTP